MNSILLNREQNTLAPSQMLGSDRRVLGMQREPYDYYRPYNEDSLSFANPNCYYIGYKRKQALTGYESYYNDKYHYNYGINEFVL